MAPERAGNDEPAIDRTSAAPPGEPPVAGAQWDEVRGRWELWDDAAQAWTIVGDASGQHIEPLHELPLLPPDLPPAVEIDLTEDHVVDVDRVAAPPQPMPGAQWNEVVGRWERWDDASATWVEAHADAPSA